VKDRGKEGQGSDMYHRLGMTTRGKGKGKGKKDKGKKGKGKKKSSKGGSLLSSVMVLVERRVC
jgi:hypothetical protein